MEKDKTINCCGMICSKCDYYLNGCQGCEILKGKVFWTEYLDIDTCEIYDCCVNQNKYLHCKMCAKLPCNKFNNNDPNKSEEENKNDLMEQLNNLNKLSK